MRNRPKNNDVADFINSATADKSTTKRSLWPFDGITYEAPETEGSNLRKSINIALKEFECNAIDEHLKLLGVPKIRWIKQAIFELMSKEKALFKKDE